MAVRAAVIGKSARRGDEQQRARRRHEAREQRREETEGGRRVGRGLRRDLVQGADREAALRQMGIEGGEPEGQGAREGGGAFHPWQPATQLVHDRGAVGAVLAKDGGRR